MNCRVAPAVFVVVGLLLGGGYASGQDEPKFLRRADGKPIPNPNYVAPSTGSGSSNSVNTFILPPYTPYRYYSPYGGYGYHRHYPTHICDVCGSPYCYDPYCDGRFHYSPRWVDPAELGYVTPESARRQFMGALRASRAAQSPRAIAVVPGRAAGGAAPARPVNERDEIAQRVSAIAASTAAERGRADRLIGQGDALFQRQAYLGALNKYESAVKSAGDYSFARYRLAHAYLAKGKFDEAITEFLIAMELADSIERPSFKLLDLYGGARLALESDLDAVSEAALESPNDGGLVMLVGLLLHYNQQPLRSRPFFQRAADLPGPQSRYAEWFLTNTK